MDLRRLDRAVQAEQDRLLTIQRQADALANGIRTRGRRPKATLAEQKACLSQMSYVADGARYLSQELHTLLEVVVPIPDGLLTSTHRQGEIVTVLDLLDELVPSATPALQGQLQMLAKQVRLALPQTLLFARRLDVIQEQATLQLGPKAVALLAWAWLRRSVSHGIRNEKQASNQRNEQDALLTSRQEKEKRWEKKSKKQRRAGWLDKKDDPSETEGRKWAEKPSRREHSGREGTWPGACSSLHDPHPQSLGKCR